MGKISCKIKKPEKLGKGQVTPIQVAYIVDRYLIDNNYTHTLSVFRSEASALFSKSKMKEAPKSLLSLGDILNEYIRLKEQRVFLDQEKSRVEKLLQGMQEVMKAYQSSDNASVSPRSDPVSSISAANSVRLNSTSTLRNITSPDDSVSLVPTVPSHGNKRKASGSVPQSSSSLKKTFQTPAHSLDATGVRPFLQEFRHKNAPAKVQHCTGYSMAQPNSHNQTLYSSSVEEIPASNCALHQSSSSKRESPSPKTPPQEHSLQTDSSLSPMETLSSPLETSSLIQSTDPSLEVTPMNGYVHSSGANENILSSVCCVYQDHHQFYSSPSKFISKRSGKKEHIKGRLDFDNSGMLMNSGRCTAAPPVSATVGGIEGDFDIDDLLNFSIVDTDVSLSYLVDFELDSQVAALADQPSLEPWTKLISSPCGEREMNLEVVGGTFSDLPSSNAVGILSEKDMNCRGDDDRQPSKRAAACTKPNSPGKRKRGFSSDQENVLIL